MFKSTNRYSFKRGIPRKTLANPYFVAKFEKTDINSFKCAVVVGKKVDKKAVLRNKIKRMMVASIRELVAEDVNFDLVIFARKAIKDLNKEDIKEELEKAFKTIKII